MAQSPHGINYSAHRPVIMSRKGIVSSAHYLASQAGLRMLQAGGNAVDAAIATATALNVVEPEMSGIGGDGFMLVYTAETGRVQALNGSGAAPLAATIDRYRDTGMPPKVDGPRSAVMRINTPGILDAWLMAHERFGSLPFPQLLEPAIELASQGFPVSHRLSRWIAGEQGVLGAHPPTARIFLSQGRPPRAGEILTQKDLARTLEKVASEGRGPFYEGDIGRAIVRACQELGGLFTDRDFTEHRAVGWSEPLATTYQGYQVYEHPPSAPGLTLLEMFNILEQFDVASKGCNSSELIHLMVEIKKLAFADREYIADPAWVEVPVERLISKEYARSAGQAHRHGKGEPGGCSGRAQRRWRGWTYYLLLRCGRSRQRSLAHPEPWGPVRLRHRGGRHRRTAERPDEPLAPGIQSTRTH